MKNSKSKILPVYKTGIFNPFLFRYRAKNRKSIIRNSTLGKEHRNDNHSPPTEKSFNLTEEYYQNTSAVSPVPIPTVVPLPRYDVSYNPNYSNGASQFSTNQQVYAPNPSTFHPEVYPNNPHNVVLAGSGQYYPAQPDYATTAPINHQTMEIARRPNWEQMANKNASQLAKNKTLTSLAELHHRKQEVISQLEKVVGKNAAISISNTATTLARQESYDLDSPYTFWSGQINSGPTFVRSDSILKDDDYVPYDAPCVSKFGPISRMHKESSSGNASQFRESNLGNSMVRRPVSSPSPVGSWIYNPPSQGYHQTPLPAGHAYVAQSAAGMGDGYIAIGSSPQVIIQRMQDPSKELIAESQRVKMQLRNLEKQLNDLKLATQGVTTLSEGDRLTQELRLIEQGIQEKQKEACLVSKYFIFDLL